MGTTFFDRVKRWWRGDMVDLPIAEQLPGLGEWFRTPTGQLLLENEQQIIDEQLPSLFGYHLLELSVTENHPLSTSSPIHHCFSISPCADEQSAALAEFEALPLESDSVDVVVLHHVLEFSQNPHQLLKEVNRILIPRGHVIIIGFNPFSLFGVWKRVATLFSKRQHWSYSTIVKHRLFDWFKLLDLEKQKVEHTFFRPPVKSKTVLSRLSFLEKAGRWTRLPFGGVYMVLACKNICAVTPIKMQWDSNRKRSMGLSTVQTTTPRTYQRNSNKKILH